VTVVGLHRSFVGTLALRATPLPQDDSGRSKATDRSMSPTRFGRVCAKSCQCPIRAWLSSSCSGHCAN